MSSKQQHAALRYTAMRLGLFVACFLLALGLNYLGVVPAGTGDSNFLWVVLLGLLFSAPLSWVLLRKQRDEVSDQVVRKIDRAKERLAANRSQEDGADDAARAAHG